MGALLSLVPWYYRWLALLVMIAAVWGHGWFTARSADEHTMALNDAKLQAMVDQAKADSLAERQRQAAALKKTVEEFDEERNEIHAYYAANPAGRVRNVVQPARCPAAGGEAPRTGGADARAAEPVAARRDQGFEAACALDAAQVNALRNFLLRNGFPME